VDHWFSILLNNKFPNLIDFVPNVAPRAVPHGMEMNLLHRCKTVVLGVPRGDPICHCFNSLCRRTVYSATAA